jgi:hypothetical protein
MFSPRELFLLKQALLAAAEAPSVDIAVLVGVLAEQVEEGPHQRPTVGEKLRVRQEFVDLWHKVREVLQ